MSKPASVAPRRKSIHPHNGNDSNDQKTQGLGAAVLGSAIPTIFELFLFVKGVDCYHVQQPLTEKKNYHKGVNHYFITILDRNAFIN